MNKSTTILLASAGAVSIAFAAAWLFVLQPGNEQVAKESEALLESGISLFDEKQYREALGVLDGVPPGSPQEAKAQYYQGSAHMMLKDYEAAAQHLERALALNTHDAGVLYALGVVYYKLGNIKLAKSYFASVLKINPDDEHAKGLMDIMAGLVREPGTEPDPAPPSEETENIGN